jgi:plastocyanin
MLHLLKILGLKVPLLKMNWQAFVSLLLVSMVLAACGGGGRTQEVSQAPAAQSQPPAQTQGGGTTVTAVATNFAFSLDKSEAQAGTITFVISNDGSAPHDFAIEGNGVEEKTKMIQAGESASLTVELTPGVYDYVCTVPGHAMLGMRGTFTVK